MQEFLFLYKILPTTLLLIPSFPKKNISLQDLENIIFRYDIRETLHTASLIEKNIAIKEAYLCLVALIEHFDSLNNRNKQMWVFSSFRIGNINGLAKDIEIWNQKLVTRLILYK